MLLQIIGLTKSFGSVRAVDHIDLAVAEGEALGVIGPNGAGKSTLFALIAGALRPDAGSVRLDGRDVTATRQHRRCRSGIARSHQIPQPFGKLSVLENVLVAAIYGEGRRERDAVEACAEILRATGLIGRANRLAGSLTLLERKRLELARALATQPRLLLLDEIAGGLTEAECAALIATIRDIKARKVTIVWVEHVVHALLAVADRLVVLNFGRKIAEGEPRAIMASREVREIYMGIPA
jgi:branched-chain amino acid transport system ATP-binding protein